eukprot:970537-Rhodomonas_salina.1
MQLGRFLSNVSRVLPGYPGNRVFVPEKSFLVCWGRRSEFQGFPPFFTGTGYPGTRVPGYLWGTLVPGYLGSQTGQ